MRIRAVVTVNLQVRTYSVASGPGGGLESFCMWAGRFDGHVHGYMQCVRAGERKIIDLDITRS